MSKVTNWDWSVIGLTVAPQKDSLTDVISEAMFKITGSDGAYTASAVCQQNFNFDPNGFVEFNNVTESQVINWIQKEMGTDKLNQLKNNIQSQIDTFNLAVPELISKPLPWLEIPA